VKNDVLEKNKTKKNYVKPSKGSSVEMGLFDGLEDDQSEYNSPGEISFLSSTYSESESESEISPYFNLQLYTTTEITSEPPSPLNREKDAKALKRVKAPKKNRKRKNKK